MNPETLALLQFLNIPYIYGGKNPMTGLDCSGLVFEYLEMRGVMGFGNDPLNYSAQNIYDALKPHSVSGEIGEGSVVFFGSDDKNIHHTAVMINKTVMIEAGHGSASILTREDAVKVSARVRLRPLSFRVDLVGALRPNYPGE